MVVIPFQMPRILQGQAPAQRLAAQHAQRLAHYQELRDFYEGRHFAAARRGRTNLVANYARAIVDKHVAYTFARGVTLHVEEPPPSPLPLGEAGQARDSGRPHPNPTEVLERILEEAGFARTLLQAAVNASVLGEAVFKVIVEVPPVPRSSFVTRHSSFPPARLRILNIDPSRFFPTFASDDPTHLHEVAVVSTISPEEASARYGLALARPAELLEVWRPDSLTIHVGATIVFEGPNPYLTPIPFVHVPNLAPPGTPWGLSDLEDVIPLNRELDERLSDQADVIRYHADPPVIFKGVREHSDLAVGPGTVWDIPSEADVTLLEWRGQTPAVDRHLDRILRALYDVAEAPRSSFGDTEQAFSGVALETQLQPIIQRTLRRRIVWEAALRQIGQYVLLLAEQFGRAATAGQGGHAAYRYRDGSALDSSRRSATPGAGRPYRVSVHWPPLLPRDDDAEASRYIALTGAGLRSHTGAMEALGVPNPESELARVAEDRQTLAPSPLAGEDWSEGAPHPQGRDAEVSGSTGSPQGRGEAW